jgi:hypothetical protein
MGVDGDRGHRPAAVRGRPGRFRPGPVRSRRTCGGMRGVDRWHGVDRWRRLLGFAVRLGAVISVFARRLPTHLSVTERRSAQRWMKGPDP